MIAKNPLDFTQRLRHAYKTKHHVDKWVYDSSGVVFAICKDCKQMTYPNDEKQCILITIKEIHDY